MDTGKSTSRVVGSEWRAPNTMRLTRRITSSPFSQFESRVIEAWLDLEPSVGPELDTALRGLGVAKEPTSRQFTRLDVAVAQIVLHAVRHRLPDFGALQADGRPMAGRSLAFGWNSSITMLPWHASTVGWSSEWVDHPKPEAYYLAWLPYYNRHVVTVSRGTSDCWGYHDAALGDFGKTGNPMPGLESLIVEWWELRAYRYKQAKWQCVIEQGLVPHDVIECWAERVWTSSF